MINKFKKQLENKRPIHFRVKIIPKSKTNEIMGMYGEDMLKIKIAAVPEKNKANEELAGFLATVFGVAKGNVKIRSGGTSPIKSIEITP